MHNTLQLQRRLAAESTLALGLKLVSLPLGYLTSLILAHALGGRGWGVYTLAVYQVTILSLGCRLGLDLGMVRFGAALKAAGRSGEIRGLFRRGLLFVAGLSLLAAGGLFLSRDHLALLFHAPDLAGLAPLMAVALPLAAIGAFCSETLRSLGGARWVVVQHDLLSPLSFLFMVGFIIWRGHTSTDSAQPVLLGYVLTLVLGMVFLGLLLRRHFYQLPVSREGGSLGDLCRYSWPLYTSALLLMAFSTFDSLVLGLFAGPQEVAYYEAAGRTALLVSLPLTAVNSIIPPLFSQLHQGGKLPELENLARASSRWMYYVALPLALFLIILAPDILALFGPGFDAARWGLRWLVAAQLINVASGSVGYLLAMTGHQVILTGILALTVFCGLPLMIGGAAFLGLNGLALAKALWLAGVNILLSLAVWHRLKIRLYASGLGWANLSGLLGMGMLWLCHPYLGPWLAGGLGAILYLTLVSKALYQELTDLKFNLPWEAVR